MMILMMVRAAVTVLLIRELVKVTFGVLRELYAPYLRTARQRALEERRCAAQTVCNAAPLPARREMQDIQLPAA